MTNEHYTDGTERFDLVGIRECARCGKVGDRSEEYGVDGIARIAGNLCLECVRELNPETTQGGQADE